MNKEIANIAFEFARRKIRFHNDMYWKDIKLFGLFFGVMFQNILLAILQISKVSREITLKPI